MTRSKSRGELAVELLKAYQWWIGAGAVVAIGAAVMVGLPKIPSIKITRPYKVAGVALLAAATLGYAPASKVLDWLYNPPRRYVVCLGLKEGAEPGVWKLSPASWEKVDVVEGQLHEWKATRWPTYEVEAFDRDELQAVGTWRGSEPDRELMRYQKKQKELREEIEPEADRTIDTELKISSRVREAVKEIGRTIIDEHAQTTTYNGERVADVLSEIRQDVEQDSGSERPENGEKPVRSDDVAQVVEGLAAVAGEEEVVPDGGEE